MRHRRHDNAHSPVPTSGARAVRAPEEILTDNGKQFTARFGVGGEVLFDKIRRKNGIGHRLTRQIVSLGGRAVRAPRSSPAAKSRSGSNRRC